ncbi:MAG: hypothetical protein KAJ11_16700 [Alphaproteobacteria bacterium]|nr:hypothetical protein [Alphaproteobacteria bacterium]
MPIIGAAIHRDPWIENFADPADLYLLTGIDMDLEGDSTRYFPDGETGFEPLSKYSSKLSDVTTVRSIKTRHIEAGSSGMSRRVSPFNRLSY